MAKRTYRRSDGSVTVHWDSDRCSKCGNCFIKLESVFQPDSRPWVKIEESTPEEIAKVVNQCPTQAISLTPHS